MRVPTPFNLNIRAGHEGQLNSWITFRHAMSRAGQGRVPVGPASGTKPILGSMVDES